MRRTSRFSSLIIALMLGACNDGSGPPPGTLELTAHTTGRNLDLDGYTVLVDGNGATALPANGTASISELAVGDHSVNLTGLSENCAVQGSLPVPITITSDSPARVDVEVVCQLVNSLAYVQGGDVYVTSIEPNAVAEHVAASSALPSWSPDGTTLAIVSRLSPSGIMLVDAAGEHQRSVTPNVATTELFGKSEWSPDGRTLLYTYRNSDSPNHSLYFIIGRAETDGSGHGPFIPGQAIGGDLSENAVWSPDGSMVAYDRYAILVAHADGSGSRSLTRGFKPVWSPDGATLAFGVDFLVGPIHTIRVDGTDERNLSPPSASNDQEVSPAWSPDGAQIAFVHQTEGADHAVYMIMNADGSQRMVLEPTLAATGIPEWSYDGLHLALTGKVDGDADDRVYVIRRDGTDLRAVTGEGACCPDWRP